MIYDLQFPWLDDSDLSTSDYPDAYNPFIYEIRREKVA